MGQPLKVDDEGHRAGDPSRGVVRDECDTDRDGDRDDHRLKRDDHRYPQDCGVPNLYRRCGRSRQGRQEVGFVVGDRGLLTSKNRATRPISDDEEAASASEPFKDPIADRYVLAFATLSEDRSEAEVADIHRLSGRRRRCCRDRLSVKPARH